MIAHNSARNRMSRFPTKDAVRPALVLLGGLKDEIDRPREMGVATTYFAAPGGIAVCHEVQGTSFCSSIRNAPVPLRSSIAASRTSSLRDFMDDFFLFSGARRSGTGVRRHGRRAARAGLRVGSGYWFLWRRAARPGPTSGLAAEGSAPGGAGGMEKLPAATRASSSWFSWSALVPAICDGGWAANPWWCVEARACRCAGGSADVVPIAPGPGAIPAGGCAAAGGAYPGAPGPGRLESGEEGPSPPGG